ncbi:MAG: putative glutathione S-transferase-related transrane protein [Acidimicrobiaceae bacterium]|nr:putative glutathione S-transferase-related transrane protein [Acidimicrobiaceae bacterium]
MSTTNDTATPETTIKAPADLPIITIERTFASTPSQVFRAFVEPELFSRWNGPQSIEARIEHWDARTGGSWRYAAWREGERIAGFYGSFHEIRPDKRLVQTFTYDGAPDGVSLDTTTFTALPDGGTRLTTLSVVESVEIRNLILASGMDTGVREGYVKLDVLLRDQ